MAVTDKPFLARFWQQFTALLWKNALVTWRNGRSAALRVLAPCFFIVLVLLLDIAIRRDPRNSEEFRDLRTPERTEILPIQPCFNDLYIGDGCKDFIYSPSGVPAVEAIVTAIRDSNAPPIPADRVQGFPSLSAANEYLLDNRERTPAGLHFTVGPGNPPALLDFALQLNSTIKIFRGQGQDTVDIVGMPLQLATQREIVRYHASNAGVSGADALSVDVAWKLFPHPPSAVVSLVGIFIGQFLFFAILYSGFMPVVINIALEREQKITRQLATMGMMKSAYWISWAVWEACMAVAITLITIAFGAAVQLNFFLKNNFFLVFFTFFLFQMAMIGFGFFIAAFLRKSSTGNIVGYMLVLVGIILQNVIASGIPYTKNYYSKWGYSLTAGITALPFAPFAKAAADLGTATTTDASPGISWADRSSYCGEDCYMTLPTVFLVFILEFLGYFLLAIYFTAVLPDENGVRESPFFFLMPGFWAPGATSRGTQAVNTRQEKAPPPGSEDTDVADERARMQELLAARQDGKAADDGSAAVEVFGLQRNFRAGKGKGKFWAICNSWFQIESRQLFCLLGPNGAGKSTTINILTGVLPPSGGDAVLKGNTVASQGGMDKIRSYIGVCPQFDVLWGELTGQEHLQLYGHIKGLKDKADVAAEANSLLAEVALTPAARLRTAGYSGGMKRRLSVALALLGDPDIVFLDEPTTGMDPVSRRQVWDIIERAKQTRAVILTTHSMEEADILGDRIAIMARGNLRCIGTSLRLKQKYGAGYQLSVSVLSAAGSGGTGSAAETEDQKRELRAKAVKDLLKQEHGLMPMDETKAYITFLVTRAQEEELPAILKVLEAGKTDMGITDIQIALTTLEEVFLNIAKQAEIDAADPDHKVLVDVGDGTQLLVQVGADQIIDPETAVAYKLTWGQDEDGSLVVSQIEPITNGPVQGV